MFKNGDRKLCIVQSNQEKNENILIGKMQCLFNALQLCEKRISYVKISYCIYTHTKRKGCGRICRRLIDGVLIFFN